jgi:hypothetical protein
MKARMKQRGMGLQSAVLLHKARRPGGITLKRLASTCNLPKNSALLWQPSEKKPGSSRAYRSLFARDNPLLYKEGQGDEAAMYLTPLGIETLSNIDIVQIADFLVEDVFASSLLDLGSGPGSRIVSMEGMAERLVDLGFKTPSQRRYGRQLLAESFTQNEDFQPLPRSSREQGDFLSCIPDGGQAADWELPRPVPLLPVDRRGD